MHTDNAWLALNKELGLGQLTGGIEASDESRHLNVVVGATTGIVGFGVELWRLQQKP